LTRRGRTPFEPAHFDRAYYRKHYRDGRTSVTSRAQMTARANYIAAYTLHLGLPVRTMLDAGCGLGLLRDPLTQQTLPTVSFDVLSPAENTSDFHRRNWFAVSAAEMPPGELVVGLNPPFGHLNKTAIDFVKHALCMRPRLLVLVMPATNYRPEGYELVHHDDQLCRGFAFPHCFFKDWQGTPAAP
jgi:hypothetical protein